MDLFAVFLHLLNFTAPAAALALLLALAVPLFWRRRPAVLAWWGQMALQFGAGCAVLLAGLWCFGRDGMMATYTVLVLVAASVQWLLLRGWKS